MIRFKIALTKNLKRIVLTSIFLVIYIITINFWISYQAKNSIHDDLLQLPKNKVGLVLSTGKYTSYGSINLYYKYRLEAAVLLYKSGKIEYVLISGDNSRKDYDEPTDFKNDLIKKGIPERKIYLDYAGFRTLDSVVRAKAIFGLESVTIISQKFHNEPVIYLAKHFKIDAIAFNARDIGGRYGLKTNLREYIARAKASLDLLFKVEPKFLGKKIKIV